MLSDILRDIDNALRDCYCVPNNNDDIRIVLSTVKERRMRLKKALSTAAAHVNNALLGVEFIIDELESRIRERDKR